MNLFAAADPFDHVRDSDHLHIFPEFGVHLHLPYPLTRYSLIMLIAAGLMIAIFIPLARAARTGEPPRGPLWNGLEAILTFIRDFVAKPYLHADADKYVPFLWTLFLFVLLCNLLGMVPFLGSPTANLGVTAALAIITFFAIHGAAIAKMGLLPYFKSYVPHIDVPFGMGYVIIPLLVLIEWLGNFIKAFVLAMRLFANIFAGHLVLAVILGFIVMVRNTAWFLFWPVTAGSVLTVIAVSFLELIVAFLQAFIFTFLAALFMGTALHPEH